MGVAAMIDGLWLRGSLAGGGFDIGLACAIARDYVRQTLGGENAARS